MRERQNYGGNFNGELIRFVLTSQEYVGIYCAVVRYFSKCYKVKVKPSITTEYVVTDGVEFLFGFS